MIVISLLLLFIRLLLHIRVIGTKLMTTLDSPYDCQFFHPPFHSNIFKETQTQK